MLLRLFATLALVGSLANAGTIDLKRVMVYGAKQMTIASDVLQGNITTSSSSASSSGKNAQYYNGDVFQKFIDEFLKSVSEESNADRLFDEFKKMYSKVYPSRAFENYSKELLIERVKMVLENNLKALNHESSYVLAINAGSDKPLSVIMDQPAGNWPNATRFVDVISKESSYANSYVYDPFRIAHQVGPVVNQGGCGACVYFAAAATIESFWARKGHQLVTLSTQQLNDCAHDEKRGNRGCDHGGGTFVPTFDYIKAHGLTSWSNYPYIAKEAECDSAKEGQTIARIEAWHPVLPHNDENALKQALEQHGPIAVAIHFNDALAHYKHGVFNGDCKGGRNHAILLVGYGFDAEQNQDYWILKNQWGENYGDHGYFRIGRNHGNMCDVAGDAVYVV